MAKFRAALPQEIEFLEDLNRERICVLFTELPPLPEYVNPHAETFYVSETQYPRIMEIVETKGKWK